MSAVANTAPKGLWLNLGCSGRTLPGFENLDRERIPGAKMVDVRLGLPYPNGSAEVVVASHVLEHLHPFTELPHVLAEIHRVLMDGGILRAAVPDLTKLTEAYVAPKGSVADALGDTQKELGAYVGVPYAEMPPALRFSVIAFGNNSGSPYYDGHQVCFDAEALAWCLFRAGFKDALVVKANETRHPTLLTRYRDIGAAEEVVLEAMK